MRFITMIIFIVTSRLATAKPIQNWKVDGIAIPLTRHSSSLNSNKIIDLDAMTSHGISVRQKILHGLENYKMNTGTMHPYAVKRSESGLTTRGASLPLINSQNHLWVGEISIGTPPKTLKVGIDTGSADMWVLQTGCTGISGDRDLWDSHSSESAEDQGIPFQLDYADGSIVEGDLYDDNVTIAGFTADHQIFGSAKQYTSQLHNNEYHADGLLGLGYPTISEFDADPLFASLVGQGKVINPKFSLKLSSSGAEMYVGGANSMLYSGDIAYTRVTDPGYWQVSMDDVRVNGDKILKNIPAVFDTGANLIFGDRERVSELYRHLGGTLEEHGNFGYYHLPCNSFPTVSFTFGGRTFKIPSEVLRHNPVKRGSPDCFSAIVADHSSIDPEFWIIGMPFLQGVYSVFDYNNFQVGFADLA